MTVVAKEGGGSGEQTEAKEDCGEHAVVVHGD